MLSFARWIASISTRIISTVSSGSSAGLGCDSAFCQRCLDCATQRNLYIGIRTRIWIAANIILNNYNKLQRYRADRYTRHAWQRQNIPLYSARMTAAKHTATLGMRDSGEAYRYTRHAWQRQRIPLYSDSTQSKHRGIIWSRRRKRVCDKKRFPNLSIQNSLPLPRYNATRRSILPVKRLSAPSYSLPSGSTWSLPRSC